MHHISSYPCLDTHEHWIPNITYKKSCHWILNLNAILTVEFPRHPVYWTCLIYSCSWRNPGVDCFYIFCGTCSNSGNCFCSVILLRDVLINSVWSTGTNSRTVMSAWKLSSATTCYKKDFHHHVLTLFQKYILCVTNTAVGRYCFNVNRVCVNGKYVWEFIVICIILIYKIPASLCVFGSVGRKLRAWRCVFNTFKLPLRYIVGRSL
jgi:hypothetical protein